VVLGVVAVDWVSFIQPTANLNVTAWNPLPALAIFLHSANVSVLCFPMQRAYRYPTG
jgi:hypothetical protein